MTSSPAELQRLRQAAIECLRRQDFTQARPMLQQLASAGQSDPVIWMGLAAAAQHHGDFAAMSQALDKALELEPQNVRALIMKGDALAQKSDRPSAVTFYNRALKIVASAGLPLALDFEPAVKRAQTYCDRFREDYDDALMARLATHGFDAKNSSPRFKRGIDILMGRSQIYLQRPKMFYVPELPQIQFYEREQFDWVPALEAQTAALKREAENVLKNDELFAPYLEPGPRERPKGDDRGMLNNRDWSAYYLIKDGAVLPDASTRCPATIAALSKAPMTDARNRMPSAIFSLLRPGTTIPPHNGFLNARLICHLPLIVPGQCALRVGSETREWKEGKMLIFDDSIEHEAWNKSSEPRLILLFEIWRPELSVEERRYVSALLEVVDEFSATPTAWSI